MYPPLIMDTRLRGNFATIFGNQSMVPFNILHFWSCFFGSKKDLLVNIFVSDYLLQNFAQTFAMLIKIIITLYTRAITLYTRAVHYAGCIKKARQI